MEKSGCNFRLFGDLAIIAVQHCPMPHGEVAYVQLFEYVAGERLLDWYKRQPSNEDYEYGRNNSAICTPESIAEAVELTVSGMTILNDLHFECHVLHGPIRARDLIIHRPEGPKGPRQLVMIDFSRSRIDLPDEYLRTTLESDMEKRWLLHYTCDTYDIYKDAAEASAEAKGIKLPEREPLYVDR